jgi:CheY-like chemotaxis protein
MSIETAPKPLALIIEDDDKLATIFTGALSMAGFETVFIANGRVALETLKEITPRLILLDLHLPEVSGDKILHAIRADERIKNAIVVLATADSSMADYLEDKSDFVLQKPISFLQLRDLAERIRKTI